MNRKMGDGLRYIMYMSLSDNKRISVIKIAYLVRTHFHQFLPQ